MLEWNLIAAPVQHRVKNHRPMNLFWGCISPCHAFQTASAHDLIWSICSVVPCFPSQGLNCGCWMMVFACFLQCWSMRKGVGYLKVQAQQVGLERLFLKDIFGMWWLGLCISINMYGFVLPITRVIQHLYRVACFLWQIFGGPIETFLLSVQVICGPAQLLVHWHTNCFQEWESRTT